MTFTFFDSYKQSMLNGTNTVDLDGDTLKVMLVTSAFTPATTTQDFIDDISANEVSGDNYTAGGDVLGSPDVSTAAGTSTFDSADFQWLEGGTGFTDARYWVLYKDTGTPATSPLIGYEDMVTDQSNDSGNFDLTINVSGIFTLSG